MPKLDWIEDTVLDAAIAKFRRSATEALNQSANRQQQNVVDPFMSLLIASTFGANSREGLLQLQNSNSALNGMANALGLFHQEVLSGVEGWENHDAGYDLECATRRILAEVKNKHNTMNSSNRQQVISDLDTAVRQKGQNWNGYLVIIVPRTPRRYTTRLGTTRPVYEVDGASFYHTVTENPNALHALFDVLCNELTNSEEIATYCRQVMVDSIPPRIEEEEEG